VRVVPGGVASVGRTRAWRTWNGGQQELRFALALNATPLAWWEFHNWRSTQLGRPHTPLEEAEGPSLINTHGMTHDLTGAWSLRIDPEQPGRHVLQADVDAVRADLPRRVHGYARRALQLLEPGRYLDELLADPDPGIGTWEGIVVLLAFGHYRACCVERDAADHADGIIAYVRGRAALV